MKNFNSHFILCLSLGCAASFAQAVPLSLPGFPLSPKVICEDALKKNSPSVELLQNMSPEIVEAFFVSQNKPSPESVMTRFHWRVEKAVIKPDLSALGMAIDARSRSEGLTVPKYTGTLRYVGDVAWATLSLSVTDSVKAVSSTDLKKVPQLARKVALTLVIEDSKGSIAHSHFEAWAKDLIAQAGLSVLAQKTPQSNPAARAAYFELRKFPLKNGAVEHTLHLRNIDAPNDRLLHLVESMHASLSQTTIVNELDHDDEGDQVGRGKKRQKPRNNEPRKRSYLDD